MKKRSLAFLLTLCALLTAFPPVSMASTQEIDGILVSTATKQMRAGVPVWDEKSVSAYALSFIRGDDLDRLWGYYDLQIRRYMPMDTYGAMLTDLEWMTGDFIGFGNYKAFAEPERKTKTHVLHLCMEGQDLDMYFTHKDAEDDWEVWALEFIPAAKQPVAPQAEQGMLVEDEKLDVISPTYTEEAVTVGAAPYALEGILTLPKDASALYKVPSCVLVHGFGPVDMDGSIGQTKLFADIAGAFAEKGIAVLRYHKRTYQYQDIVENMADLMVEEVIRDAVAAARLLKEDIRIDNRKIVLVGHDMGAMMAPRIASEADGLFGALLMIGGTPKPLPKLTDAQNAEIAQHESAKLIKKLRVPVYIVQGGSDSEVPVKNGIEAYEDQIGDTSYTRRYIFYKTYKGLNHLLMKYMGDPAYKGTDLEYDVPIRLDTQASRDMALWIHERWQKDDE